MRLGQVLPPCMYVRERRTVGGGRAGETLREALVDTQIPVGVTRKANLLHCRTMLHST